MVIKQRDLVNIDKLLYEVECIINKYELKVRLDTEENVLLHNIRQFRDNIMPKVTTFRLK